MKRIVKLIILLGIGATIFIACQKEAVPQRNDQNNFPITPRSSTLWHAIPSSVPTINHMYNPADLDDQGVNMAMYATGLVLKELVCQFPGFSMDLYNARDNNHEVILKDFFDAHSVYQTFAETEYANLGESYQEIMEEGTLAYDDRWGMSVYMPHHVDSLGEEFPRWPHIGIGTDVEDQDDVDMEYIPAFINQNRQGCDYEDGLIGLNQPGPGRVDPVTGTIVAGTIVLGTFVWNSVFLDTEQYWGSISNWPDVYSLGSQTPNCDLGINIRVNDFSIDKRFDRNRRSEVQIHYATRIPISFQQSLLPGWSFYYDEWASANRPYRLGKVDKNNLGSTHNVNLELSAFVRNSAQNVYLYPGGFDNQSVIALYGGTMIGMVYEHDWYAKLKTYNFFDSNGYLVQFQGRMKYGSEIYNRFLIGGPFDWCAGRQAIFKDEGHTTYESII